MSQQPTLPQQDKLTRRRRIFKSFEAKALANRRWSEQIADYVSSSVGSVGFLVLNLYWFLVWIILNINIIPDAIPFDPYPFGLLTMIVSLEAIILSIFVLLSQNRAASIDKLRNELHLQVNLIAEEEITKSLELLAEIRSKLGIRKKDPELEKMLHRIDTSYIESSLQKQIDSGTVGIKQIISLTGNATPKPHEKLDSTKK